MITFGVEEEYLLVDPLTGEPVHASEQVRLAGPEVADDTTIDTELLQAQVEIATPICSTLAELRAHLVELRTTTGAAAVLAGCRIAATGAAPMGRGTSLVTKGERYRAIAESAPQLAFEMLINGMHVHAAVPDRTVGVAVTNRLRPWLGLLVALGANSPFSDGHDTGFASWRSIQFERWPVSGPPPWFESVEEFDARAQDLLTSGVILDLHQLYYLARISDRWPTVEVRACDVQLTIDDAVLLAGITRALVETALGDELSGTAQPHMHQELVRAATWGAARHGLTGSLLDPLSRELLPAADVAAIAMDHVTPALRRTGDLDEVATLLAGLLASGTGADRQRRAFADGGMPAVAALLVAETARGTRV
ncbi:MAG: carboxylate--amine ligase [Frankiales bacterium]|nr:carboxylate--amine ligase [Frankiales bacterium]